MYNNNVHFQATEIQGGILREEDIKPTDRLRQKAVCEALDWAVRATQSHYTGRAVPALNPGQLHSEDEMRAALEAVLRTRMNLLGAISTDPWKPLAGIHVMDGQTVETAESTYLDSLLEPHAAAVETLHPMVMTTKLLRTAARVVVEPGQPYEDKIHQILILFGRLMQYSGWGEPPAEIRKSLAGYLKDALKPQDAPEQVPPPKATGQAAVPPRNEAK